MLSRWDWRANCGFATKSSLEAALGALSGAETPSRVGRCGRRTRPSPTRGSWPRAAFQIDGTVHSLLGHDRIEQLERLSVQVTVARGTRLGIYAIDTSSAVSDRTVPDATWAVSCGGLVSLVALSRVLVVGVHAEV